MTDHPKIIRPAAYTLITHGESLLMCRLCPPERWAGWWTLPGGGLDFGESPESGAVRETLEETGLEIELGELVEVQSELFEFPDKDMHAIRFLYRVTRWGGQLLNEVDGSTDTCAFIPFAALDPTYRHGEFGEIRMVELARRGLELARGA